MSLDVSSYIVVGEKLLRKAEKKIVTRYDEITGKPYEKTEYEDKLVLEQDESFEISEDHLFCDVFYDPSCLDVNDSTYLIHGIIVSKSDIKEETVDCVNFHKLMKCIENFFEITDRKASIFNVLDYSC